MGIKSYNQAKTTLTREIRVAKRSCSKKLENSLFSQWPYISVERPERYHKLQGTIPQFCTESTTDRKTEWFLLQIWKCQTNTPHPLWRSLCTTTNTSSNPTLFPSCTSDQWRGCESCQSWNNEGRAVKHFSILAGRTDFIVSFIRRTVNFGQRTAAFLCHTEVKSIPLYLHVCLAKLNWPNKSA